MSSGPSEMPQPTMGYGKPQTRSPALYSNLGVVCSIIALFILPEIFGAAAIILGAYAWRLECGGRGNRGVAVIIIGIVAMLVGIYYTSFFGIYNILP